MYKFEIGEENLSGCPLHKFMIEEDGGELESRAFLNGQIAWQLNFKVSMIAL